MQPTSKYTTNQRSKVCEKIQKIAVKHLFFRGVQKYMRRSERMEDCEYYCTIDGESASEVTVTFLYKIT